MAKSGDKGGRPPSPPLPVALSLAIAGPSPPPALEATTESVTAYVSWAQREFDAGIVEPRHNDQRMKLVGEMRKVIALKHNLAELEELRAMVKRSESAANRRKANETEDRYGQGADAPPFGRVPLKT